MNALRRGAGFAALIGFLVPGIVAVGADTSGGELAAETLASITGLTPQDFGAATVDGLEYADPTEALGIIEAPVPNSDGSVDLSFPLGVPPGHGITPELTVQYGSGGGNGWMGEGWDLGVGDITVDTTFGAPHFDPDSESESYLLDGALLTPNANDDAWEARVTGDRNDFARQVETDYDEIIRHQPVDDVWPADYFWEVRGKDGSVRWYGGTPDSGGPAPSTAPLQASTIDESAVVRNEAGHIVTWLLSAERDIGVNLIRYEYETVEYEFDGTNWRVFDTNSVAGDCDPAVELCGQHTYLDRILYTDATSSITDRNGPPYEIDFLRESEPLVGNTSSAVRKDPIIDAGLGYVDVIADRLARVEVKHGAPPPSGTVRDYSGPGNIAARYDFRYDEGRFGKTLLSKIIQGVDDPYEHVIEYYDDLTGTTDVNGFADSEDWTTGDDVTAATYLDATAEVSVLGGSETNGGSGNIYIGFNPITPSKTFSFGVGLELSGSDTEALVEWIDLNGDNLPDKVYLQGGELKFRLNASGPDGGGFDQADTAPVVEDVTNPGSPQNIDELSKNSNFAFQISAEAYPVVALGIGTGLAFSWANTYFSDVNGDGLVDFVRGGTVHFNALNEANIPTFSTSSAATDIPLAPSPLPDISSQELQDLSDQLSTQSPPVDTVRRWVAPFDGTISIVAPVTLAGPGLISTDGVRVAVQHNDTEVDDANLTAGSVSAFPDPTPSLQNLTVVAGDNIYFRVGAGPDGTNDLVQWRPVITYVSPTWSEFDVNGLSQRTFAAETDFTLAGRPNDFIAMPNTGVARVTANVSLAEPLTDDVRVVVVKRDPDDNDTATVIGTILAGTTALDPATPSALIPVALTQIPAQVDDPSTPDPNDTKTGYNTLTDKLSVYLAADSPVDLSAIDFSAVITYDSAVDDLGAAIPVVDGDGNPVFVHHVRPHVEIYPSAFPAVPPVASSLNGNNDVLLQVTALTDVPDALDNVNAVITVKTASGLVKKVETTLAVSGNVAATPSAIDLDIPSSSGDRFVDISIRDNVFSRGGLELTKFVTVSGAVETDIENATLRWSGMQGIFPQSYRGWGIAGYTAAGDDGTRAMEESAFVIDAASYPTEIEEPSRGDVSLDEEQAEPSYAFAPAVGGVDGTTAENVTTDRWVGPRANLFGDASSMSTSLLGVDSVDFSAVTSAPNAAGGRSAPTRLGITGPGLTLSFGVGIIGASAGLSMSYGITDFEDLNGDGFPDVVSAGNVTYTDQLGGYRDSVGVEGTAVTNQDLTISVNGGLSAGMVDINANPKGSTNSVSGDAAGKGSSASDSGPSYSLGISGSGGYSWSSPNASGGSSDPGDGTYAKQVGSLQSDFGASGGPAIQRAFADVNGDGLPDSVYTDPAGVFAFYNLGYGFTAKAVKLGDGGFESRESAVGGAGVGFSLPYGEFGGGVNFLWNYDWSTYSWNDINGDGILDQLRRVGDNDIRIRFGTGSGLLPSVSYGDFASVPVSPGIPSSQQISFDRTSGVGGGVSATAYIGPLCLVACYLVIGGGGGYNNSRSSSSADIQDVNGDGFADALLSLNDDKLSVALNQQKRTNLLKTVTNPLGGSFTVDYERAGNTVDHPDSIWVMSRIDIDDGRSTPGATPAGSNTTGHYASTIDYAGLDYDRTHRASLGFDTVTVTELDTVDGGAAVRINEQVFLNDNIFVKGLLTKATMYELDGAERVAVRGSTVTWGFRDLRPSDLDGFNSQLPVATISADALVPTPTATVGSRGRSIAPLMSSLDEYWSEDGTTSNTIFEKRTEYTHDGLGNVIEELDLGAPDDDFDDLRTEIDYSDCTADGGSSADTVNGCLPISSPRQPLWSPGMCINWASFPTRVSVFGVEATDGGGTDEVLLRERLSPVQMCDNGAATVLQELVSNTGGSKVYATSDLTLNQYGDYAIVMAPAGSDGTRYTVRYEYDDDRHSDISLVEEFDVSAGADATEVLTSGLTTANSTAGISSSATFDPLSGRVASKTDGNGARRDYSYDEHGRIVLTSTMSMTSSITPLITYEYNGKADDYGYAIARHVDSFDGNSLAGGTDSSGGDTTATIDTITFVDGLGRVRQTKRDARLSLDGGATTVNTRQVTDGVEFDVLARPVIQYGPTADPGAAAGFSPDVVDGEQTVTEWFSYDLPYTVTEPGARTTTYDYPWIENGAGVLLAWTVATDPEGRTTTIGQDVRDVERLHIDQAAPRPGLDPGPELETNYLVNSLGELRAVVDSTGAVTEYDYDLTGKTTRAFTPNGGTVTYSYDLAGNQRVMVNDAMAAINEETTYEYQFNRLTNIDHPGTVDDITYEYGLDNSDNRYTAGRIRHIEDRTRLVENTYDKNGAMTEQTAIIKRHNWRPTMTPEELLDFAYTTRWSYDPLGRIESVGYPDAKSVSFLPDGESVAELTSPAELAPLLDTVGLEGETVTYDYDSGGLLREVTGAEEGIQFVDEQIAPDLEGNVATIQVPRRVTHEYPYLDDRVYEPRLLAIRDQMGNGTISDYSFDVETRWLESKKTTSADPDPAIASRIEVQDIEYTYDIVGRPETYDNNLPLANRAINGGDVHQEYSYDGFGRLRGASGTFDLKAGEQQRYTYGVEFTADAPWSVVAKEQQDALFTTKGKASTKVNVERTYDFRRDLRGLGDNGDGPGPLQAVSDDLTVGGETATYDYVYNRNGAIDSMLAAEEAAPAPTTTTIPRGRPKPAPTPVASETNVWDRTFTWTLTNQMTSASDGSELRTFAYDDTGALMIQDGNLLSRDGEVLRQSGGGPETIFLNAWVTVRSQKIYKHVRDGLDTIATKMDSGAGYEAKQMFIHTDVVGSTNIVTDNQGRGFQRHEYFPSGEIWINDHKEEIRTPFQFADGYYEDEFDLILFGARWYDTERELFLSPDPLLSSDVQALIGQPSLGGAYTYAGANAVSNVDPSGLQFFGAHQRVDVKAKAQESFEIDQFVLKISGEGGEAQTKLNNRIKQLEGQARAEAVLEPNAIIKIDLAEGTVSVGAPYGPRKEWQRSGGNSGSQAAPTDDQALDPSSSSDDDSIDATNGSGGPDAGGDGVSPGSATIGLGDDAGEGSSPDAPDDQPSPKPDQQGAAGGGDLRLDD